MAHAAGNSGGAARGGCVCARCIRCTCSRFSCRSCRASIRWWCAIIRIATRWTSTLSSRSKICTSLRQSQSKWDQRYAELLEELEQPDLLYLALLLHDTGKASKTDDHVRASLDIAKACLERLDLDEVDRDTVFFLIGKHLEMSATLRRDIFDPEVVRQFGEKVETPERLKMLCLLTYADIKAVNPEALTPWKAENIWQLYIGTANYMIRSVDERLHVAADDETLAHLRTLAPAAGKKLESFLEGLPRRYLRTHSVEEVLAHVAMAGELGKDNVQIGLKRGRALVRSGPRDHGSTVAVCERGGRARLLGHEYCEGCGVFERSGNRRRYVFVHGSFPHARTEFAGVGALQAKPARRAHRKSGSRENAARAAAFAKNSAAESESGNTDRFRRHVLRTQHADRSARAGSARLAAPDQFETVAGELQHRDRADRNGKGRWRSTFFT